MKGKSRKIRIAHVSHYPHLKMGGQRSMSFLIKNLAPKKFKSFCICPGEGELSEYMNELGVEAFFVPLTALKPKNIFKVLANIRLIRKFIKEKEIDIIHPDHDRDAFTCGIAKLGTDAKMVWHLRLTSLRKTDKINSFLADGMIGVSDGTKKRFPESVLAKKYKTIYNGVDCEVFSPVDNKDIIRKELNIPSGRPVITFVGQFKQGKGIFDLLKAVDHIIKNNLIENPLFLMIGEPQNDLVLTSINEIIKEKDLDQFLKLIPQQKNIHNWMQASDLVLLPSHEGVEGMPRVIYEAMACGTAVAGTNISGTNEVITQKTGILTEEKNYIALSEAVAKIINDNELRNSFEKECRNHALEFFDIKAHAKNVQDFYLKILGRE